MSAELLPRTFGYAFAKATAQYGGFMPHNTGAGIGGEIGVLSYLSWGQIRLGSERLLSDNWFLNQSSFYSEAVYNITQNMAIASSYCFKKVKPHSTNTVTIGIRYFF